MIDINFSTVPGDSQWNKSLVQCDPRRSVGACSAGASVVGELDALTVLGRGPARLAKGGEWVTSRVRIGWACRNLDGGMADSTRLGARP